MQQAMIYVDVCGAVANPGVFQLAAGSGCFRRLRQAGGYLPEAALTCVNRAGVLTDGQQLYILTQEEMERQGLDPVEMAKASDGQMNGSAGTGQNTGMTAQVQQDNRINIIQQMKLSYYADGDRCNTCAGDHCLQRRERAICCDRGYYECTGYQRRYFCKDKR